ncbi:selenium metabolism-associated LysR family transcriptional regulator [Bacillus sp. FJAT-44742]|uniref:selenium metabolism-associated LysR family transcriptional regulator n=1 Tax=Bacillus sp. FJAT-44742 TaxID=2014005 RepID=UPI000C233C1D|nr:selenium metabolism-associated LysR family transcriptional regulator [Bacillus sp. FJAT-44742]
MNLKRVETFLLLIDHKSFSVVADLLNISQPGVTKQLKTLEKDLGSTLLHRTSLEPTEAGRIVYKKGRHLLREWKLLKEECQAFQNHLTGFVRVGASTIPSTYIVPPLLKTFITQNPHVEISLTVDDSEKILDFIQNDKLDIGIIGCKTADKELHHKVITQDKLTLIGPNDSEEIKDFEDIRDLPFIFRSEQSGTWKAVQQGLAEWGGSVNELHCLTTVHSTESVITMVESGLGYSIVSHLAARNAYNHKRIKILLELPINREFYCVYPSHKQNNFVVRMMIDLIEKEIKEGNGFYS